MVTRRRKKRTTKKTRRTTKKGDGKWKVPSGFVVISKDAAKSLAKSYKALNQAMAYMIHAEHTNAKARYRRGV